jgi:hypothetical protein
MKQIALTTGQVAIVDDEDFERLNRYNWQLSGQYAGRCEYLGHGRQRTVYMHHEIRGKGFDHKNRNKLDNQKHNLRRATRAQNAYNSEKQRGKSSQFKGVHFHKRLCKWCSSIRVNRRLIHLGYFESETEAAKAYNRAIYRVSSDFAVLNNIT